MQRHRMGAWCLVLALAWGTASAAAAQPASAPPSTPPSTPAPAPAPEAARSTTPPGPAVEERADPQEGPSPHNALVSLGASGVMVVRKEPGGRDRYRFRAVVLTLGYRYQLHRGVGLQVTAHGGVGGTLVAAVASQNARFRRDRKRAGLGYSLGSDLALLLGRRLFYAAPSFSVRALMGQPGTVDLTLRHPDGSDATEHSVGFDPPILLLGGKMQFGFRLMDGRGDLAFGLDMGRARGDGHRYMGVFARFGVLLPAIARSR